MFGVLPSCLAANVRADAPNPRSSLSDPCSSAADEWKECLLECSGELINDISDSQEKHLLWDSVHLSYICSLPDCKLHLHNINGHRPSVNLNSTHIPVNTRHIPAGLLELFYTVYPKNPSTTWNSCRSLLSVSSSSQTGFQLTFVLSLKSCSSWTSTLHLANTRMCRGNSVNTNMLIFTVLIEPCWALLQQDAPSEFALQWNDKYV